MLLEYSEYSFEEAKCRRETRDHLLEDLWILDLSVKVGINKLDGEEMLSLISEERLNFFDFIIEQTFILPDEFPQHPPTFHHDLLVKPQITLNIICCLLLVKIT
jgi:hypothetical protein